MAEDELKHRYDTIVIGGSAGGLDAILQIIDGLQRSDFAIILVLHRKVSYDSVLAEILSGRSLFVVKEAEEKEQVLKGSIYLAPADYHLLIEKDFTVSLDDSEKINFSRPSIDVSFETAAEVYGNRLIGILLSGGNSDGVEGLRKIREAGGLCIVQDPDSAVVSVMPAIAITELKVNNVLTPGEMAVFINGL
jgi:two-component system, chemotaxis family, protein-glutamate methylesterase/glutaminase